MNKDLLELYSDYLLSAFSHTTATGLSAMTGGSVSHDKISRFLANEELDSAVLWLLVKPMVRQLDGQEVEREEPAVLIIDDTIEEKPYTDESKLVCWHYYHSQGRNVKGMNLISALYQAGEASVPVATKLNHFAIRSVIYLKAVRASYEELRRMRLADVGLKAHA